MPEQPLTIQYLQLNVRCQPDFSDVLIAELAEIGFDIFEENKSGFSAFAEEEKLDFDVCKELLEQYADRTALSYGIQKVARENWNKQWESHYPPVVIDNRILIRTSFHQVEETYPVEILITPKMSFGTGHHATTAQMLSFLLDFPPKGKAVVDAGCGTGILAIMAEKEGASAVLAFDNDPWCIENSEENFRLNHCQRIKAVLASGIQEVEDIHPGVILANINKNIILRELPAYANCLEGNGQLFLSGFYSEDVADIKELAEKLGLHLFRQSERDNWACLIFQKDN
jgi:ribosomal protein L11 methyltransferase